MKSFFPVFALAAALAVPASAQDATPKADTAETAKQPKQEKKICKRVPVEIGSRKMERICLTPGEWREANNQ